MKTNRPLKPFAPLAMGLAAILLWPAPAQAALSERGGTGVWEVQSAESHRPARLELGFFSTYQRLGLRDSADTQLNELIGGANAVFGIPGGFEISGMLPFYNDYTTIEDGAAPNDDELAPKLGDLTARLRWSGPLIMPGMRWGVEGEAVFAIGNDRERTYAGRAPTQVFTASENSYTGRALWTWDGLRAGSGVPMRLHGNAAYTFQGDDSRFLVPQAPLPLEGLDPSRNRDNDYLTLGGAVEIDLPRLTLFGEVVTNQFVHERGLFKGEENRIAVTPGVRFWLPGGVSIGGAWSFNISDDDPATAFDPAHVFPKNQWRVALSLGTVYRGASAKAEDALATAPAPAPAAPAPAAAVTPRAGEAVTPAATGSAAAIQDSVAAEKERQQREIIERRGVQEAPKDTMRAKPAAKPTAPTAPAAPAPGAPTPAGPATGPLTDTDRDGIPDAMDQCVLQPEDWDGFQDLDGCPDLDNDRDGILDVRDQCPNDPETYNGYYDFDGCPDEVQVKWIGAADGATVAPPLSAVPDSAVGAGRVPTAAAAPRTPGPAPPGPQASTGRALTVVPDTAARPVATPTPARDSLRAALEAERARSAALEVRAQRAEAERLALLEQMAAQTPDSVAGQRQAEAAARLAAIEARQQMLIERGAGPGAPADSALSQATADELRQMILADRQRQAEAVERLRAVETRQQLLAERDDRTTIPVPSGATTVVTPRTGDTAELAARIAVLEARLASRDGAVESPEPPTAAPGTLAVVTPPAAPRPPAPEVMDRLAAIEDSFAALASDRSARSAADTQRAEHGRLDALLPVGVTRVFPEIVFSSESAGLDAAAVARVHDIAAALAAVPDAMVRVVGHTDDRGAASFNQRVSESRAATVADLMFARGVARNQVIAEGRGESDPLADNATAEGRRVNRRVEFTRIR